MTVNATTTGFISNIQGVSTTTFSDWITVLRERVDQHRLGNKKKKRLHCNQKKGLVQVLLASTQ